MDVMGPSWMVDEDRRRKRWAHLTEGKKIDPADRIGRPAVRRITETLLDNTALYYMRQGQAQIKEDVVTTSNVDPFTTFAFPLVRRVFPRLLANDLFSVQPMTQPTGKVFFKDSKYTGGDRRDQLATFNKGYATTGENVAVAEVSLAISDVNVAAEEKKLKAKWTIESAQDLMAYHNLQIEPELMADVADELVREIDRTLIDNCLSLVPAANKLTFSKTTPTSGAYSTIDPKIYKRTLWDKICDANNLVFKKRYKNATWILAGADAATWLEKLDEFTLAPTADPTEWQTQWGAHFFGVLGGRWLIFKDAWFDVDTLLLGYKGPNFMDAGYVYSPYIPAYTTPAFTDPGTFTTTRGMMSRYAKTMVIDEMYASIVMS